MSLLVVSGCLPAPAGPRPGAVPTGEPVAVVDDVVRWTTTYQEKVGETDIKNADGETVMTKEHYRQRTKHHAKKVWYGVQGRQQLADEDFFRITGNERAALASADLRAKGRRYVALGFGGMALGVAAMIAGRVVAGSRTGLAIGLYSGGSIIGLIGGYGYLVGWRLQSPDTHAVDRSEAEMSARQYNQKLGRGASITLMERSF